MFREQLTPDGISRLTMPEVQKQRNGHILSVWRGVECGDPHPQMGIIEAAYRGSGKITQRKVC